MSLCIVFSTNEMGDAGLQPQARVALLEIRETGRALRGNVSIACVPTVGVQFVAKYAREDLLLRVAAQLEATVPWRDRRPPVHA